MKEVVILIPDIDPEQNVEIEVRINGRKKTLNYRVELMTWEGEPPSPEEAVTVLRHKVDSYDKSWELVEIGEPTHDGIPLMFRKRPEPGS